MTPFRNRPRPHKAPSAQLGKPSTVEWKKTPAPAKTPERPGGQPKAASLSDAEMQEAFEKAVMPGDDENDV